MTKGTACRSGTYPKTQGRNSKILADHVIHPMKPLHSPLAGEGKIGKLGTLLAERHHFRLPVAERVKRFVGFAAGASASKALTASATRKQAFVEFWW